MRGKCSPLIEPTTAILRPMRLLFPILALLLSGSVRAQASDAGPSTALSFARSVNLPMNAVQLHDAAMEAWTWTFGKEPGGKLLITDRTAGTLKGTARMNFRSAMLTGREETTGTVSYTVTVQVGPGECRITITELTHTGNRNTTRGGIHLKQLMRHDEDAHRAGGMGRTNVVRLHRELREAASAHLAGLLQTFEARMRAKVEP